MKPDSTSYENILEVENWGSQLSTFYKIMSPVQITLESCTGLGETDQYSIQMFSPNGCWLHEKLYGCFIPCPQLPSAAPPRLF